MCIRDRRSTLPNWMPWWRPAGSTTPWPVRCLTCLLYTSDAADDLTRVDLGGGRFFQAEDGIRDLVRSRGLGDVYKRQAIYVAELDAMVAAGRLNDSMARQVLA